MTTRLRTAQTYTQSNTLGHDKTYCGESLTTQRQGSPETGLVTFRAICGYPFRSDGVCANRDRHADPLACLGNPT